MSIDLWAVRLERGLTEREYEGMLALLPEERRERVLRLRDVEKRREPLCAYLLLRMALLRRMGWRELPIIALGARGKPYFPDHPEVHFNLSHTGGAVLAALAGGPVGVDIERIRPVGRRTMERLAGCSNERDFFRSWVRREARSKRSGDGIGTMMRSETPLQQGEFYYEIDTFPGYAAGLATRSREPLGELRRYSLADML